MICSKCGQELKDGAKFCTKCGYKFLPQKEKLLNGIAIPAIILILIGIIAYIGVRFLGLSKGVIIGRVRWWDISDLTLFGGAIIAFISIYKEKNKLALIAGIAACAFYPLIAILYVIIGF